MPNLPLISAPETDRSAFNPARASPSLAAPVKAPTIRANPDMYSGVYAGLSRVGEGIAEVGELGARIKNATDTAYVTRAQTQMQAATADFNNWTKTNPDPATWQEELDARLSNAKEDIQDGAKGLSMMAQMHLKTTLGAWEVSTRKGVQLQATEQNLQIAQASYNDFVTQATANNDLPAIEQKVQEGIATGIYHPTTGQNIIKRARVQVTMNQANAMIDADPFDAERQMTAKAEDGSYQVLGNLPATARETLVFRAHKAAAETRANTMREWSQMVADAQQGNGPLPDRESIEEEAKHQGISPKWVAKLFTPPKAQFDPKQFATDRNELMSLDLANDPQSVNHARAMEIVSSQPAGPAREEMKSLMDKRSDPKSALNSAAAKDGIELINERYRLMEKQAAKNVYVPPAGEVPGHWKATTNQAVIDRAQVTRAQVQTAFGDFMEKNPQAKPDEVQKFIHDAFTVGGGGGAAVFGGRPINPQTGNVPPPTKTTQATKAVTPEQARALPAGTRYLGVDGIWRTR